MGNSARFSYHILTKEEANLQEAIYEKKNDGFCPDDGTHRRRNGLLGGQ